MQILNKVLLFDPRKPWSDQQPQEIPPFEAGKGPLIPRAWSPDGRKLACDYRLVGGIVVYAFESKQFDRPFDNVANASGFPSWLGDSRRLLFTARNGDLMLLDTQSRKSRVVLSMQPDAITGRASHDNRQIVFSRATVEGDIFMLTFK